MMVKIKYNLNEGFKLVPEGEQVLEIVKVEAKPSGKPTTIHITFKDATGEIIIEIDDEDWNGNKVTPEDIIVINGEVDKDVNETTKIDVDTFTIKN